MKIEISTLKAALAFTLLLLPLRTPSLQAQPAHGIPTNQIIIKYRDDQAISVAQAAEAAQMARLSAKAGVALTYFRPMSGDAHVLLLPQRLPLTAVERIAAQLSTLPEVEYAEPDYVMLPALVPNDPRYNEQWHYYETYGINLPQAWDITTGTTSTVVAVIDTGHRPHADLASRIVGGYDFISDPLVANDGDGRDPDPQDPGDWVTSAESSSGYFAGCPVRNSSWHGTHVAGTIGAVTNNGQGVAGVNWRARLLSVRVLGKCGGYTSDVVDGMRWAAGLPVSGVPTNTHPAKVLNLSLGGSSSSCPHTYQSAINAVNAAGSIVVVAAGNSNTNASGATPANCNGVITVGATNRNGVRASYSNYGSVVDISAPGGQMPPSSNGVLSTFNAGTTTPGTDNYAFYQGTSMAAPHVAGVVSLMVGLRPALNWSLVETILKNTAKPFGPGHTCTGATTCGAGIVNAHAALQATLNIKQAFLPIITGGSGSGSGGSWVNITRESFEGSTRANQPSNEHSAK
jgi:serine protease